MQSDNIPIPPALVVVFGLPGTGKTTLATALSARLGWPHFNTDMIRDSMGKRKQYDSTTKESIYEEMRSRTSRELMQQKGVILDGTFYKESLRAPFRKLAEDTGVAVYWIEMLAPEAMVRSRVAKTRPYSEADFEVYQKIRKIYEPLRVPAIQLTSGSMTLDDMLEKCVKYISR